MAITKIQQSAVGKFTGHSTCTLTLNGVAAGSSLIIVNGTQATDGVNAACSVSDSAGGAFTLLLRKNNINSGVGKAIELWYKHAVSSGTHTITITATNGAAANRFGQAMMIEYGGLANAAPAANDFGGTITTNTAPATNTTGTLANNNELVVAVVMGVTSMSGGTSPAHSAQGTFTNLYNDFGTSETPFDVNHILTIGSTAQVFVDWGTLNANTQCASIVAGFVASTAGTWVLPADTGHYTFNGSTYTRDYYVNAAFAAQNMVGQTVGLQNLNNYIFTAAAKIKYTFAGQAANLTYSPAASVMRSFIGPGESSNNGVTQAFVTEMR